GTPFSNVLRNKFKELFILTQTILQSRVSTNVVDGLNDMIHFNLIVYPNGTYALNDRVFTARMIDDNIGSFSSIATDVARLASEFGVLLDDRGELTRDYIDSRDLRSEVNNFTQLLNRVVQFAQLNR
ncbi:hypothetical protein, partial [Lactobacillus gasseri]|uniref:hypothetical protein n=1 Tax=Lactobacillus gasseri TaxID=1596 RepID=UPI0029C33476